MKKQLLETLIFHGFLALAFHQMLAPSNLGTSAGPPNFSTQPQ